MDEAEISLNDIVSALKKRWLFILLPTVLISGLTAIYAHHLPKQYESTAMIRLGSVGSDVVESVAASSVVMQSAQLREKIAEKMGRADDEKYILSLMEGIEYTDAAGMLQITVKDHDPVEAKKLVEVVSAMILERQQAMFAMEKKNLAQVIDYVKLNIHPMPLSSGIREFILSEPEFAVPANLPKSPVPNKKHFTSVAFVLSLVLLSFIALFLERDSIVKKV
jgi:capsular polysaccharide biosynthesis protein